MRTKRSIRARWWAMVPAASLAAALVAGGGLAPQAGATPAPSYSPAAAPVPSGAGTGASAGGTISAVTCPAAGTCLAVGTYRTSTGGHAPLAVRYADGSWTDLPLPAAPGALTGATASGSLAAISCWAPDECVAVGEYSGSTSGHPRLPLVMELSAARWTALRAPEPSTAGTGTHQYASLYSVSCPAAGVCASVGTYENTQGGSEGLVETLTAGTWAPTAVPGPTGAKTGATSDVYLASVSCSSTAACEAVGYYQLAANGYPGLIDTFDGTTWTPTEAPQPAGAATAATKITFTLTSVACPAVGSCVAVGQFHDVTGTGHAQGLVEVLSGGTWTSATLPVPATAGTGTDQFAELYGVSCPAAGSCAAVGRYKNTKGDTQGLIGVLSGTTWIGLASPLPSNAGTVTTVYSNLDAVTCPLPGACTAVGTSGGHYHGLIDTLSEGAWTATAAPEPSTAGAGAHQDASLGSVACSGATCAAGGYFDNAAGGSAGLLETTGTAPSGYFEAASDGGIFSFTAPFHGSM
nr:hypothetical protein [Actinomycetota bacterium]